MKSRPGHLYSLIVGTSGQQENVATMLNIKLDFYCCDNSVGFCKSSHIYVLLREAFCMVCVPSNPNTRLYIHSTYTYTHAANTVATPPTNVNKDSLKDNITLTSSQFTLE